MKPEDPPVIQPASGMQDITGANGTSGDKEAPEVVESENKPPDESYDNSADGFHGKIIPEKQVYNGGDDEGGEGDATFLTTVKDGNAKKKMLSKEDEDLGIYEDTDVNEDDLSDTETELERLRAEKKRREQEENDKLRAEQKLKEHRDEVSKTNDFDKRQAQVTQNVRSLTDSAIKQIEKQMITPRTDVSLDSRMSSKSWSDPRFLQGISIRDLHWKTDKEAIPVTTSMIAEIQQSRKNVLFIVSDDLRPQLGAYEDSNFPTPIHPHMHTPNIDALASRSLLLKRAYVQQAVCSPSRTSFLTGRRPDTTHVYDLETNFRIVGENFTTLPEYFKQLGYKTFGMGKIYHGINATGLDDAPSWSEPYFHGVDNFGSKHHSWLAVPDDELNEKPLIDRQIADQAIKTLRTLAPTAKTGETQFFMAVGFRKPHMPFVFPESVMQTNYPENSIRLPANPYAPVNMPTIAWYKYGELRYQYDDIKALNVSGASNTTLPDQVTLNLRRAYYSAVTWVDSLVGEVISELEHLGLSNSTVISFIGDHGWQLGEHGEWGKVTNFEIATHAPMMIHIPGMTDNGIATDQLVEFVDLYPSIVEAAGLSSLPLCPEDSVNTMLCREGTSLLPLIKNPNIAIKKTAFSQYPRGTDVMGYSMRTERYRYTEWVDFKYAPEYKPNWDRKSGVELYDHKVDPEENYNAADDAKYQLVRAELSKLLYKGWRHTPNAIDEIIG